MAPLVRRARRGAVEVLTLNRPERRNAWTDQLSIDYVDALRDAERDQAVRAIVVTGAGRSFCVGGDVEDLEVFVHGRTFETEGPRRQPAWLTTTIGKPVIAAINGACAGIGLAQALTCDIRIAAAAARFTTAYARRGLPAESGLAWLLPRMIGVPAALDLLVSARLVEADEAERLGLVHRVARGEDVLEAAVRYATDLADHCSPEAMATIKHQIWEELGGDALRAASDRADELAESAISASPDVLEGIRSFVERRSPSFAPLALRL